MLQPCRIVTAIFALGLIAACGGGGGVSSLDDGKSVATPTPAPAACSAAPIIPAGTSAAAGPTSSSSILYAKGDSGRVWVVNPDNDSVSVIDARSMTRIAEVPVGGNPRTLALAGDGCVWVANRDSATISVVDPASLQVAKTVALPRASQPFGIVFSPSDGTAWLTLEALGQVARLDPASGAITASLEVGPNPRHLSMTHDGRSLLVSRFISPPLPGEAGANPQARVNGVAHGGELVVADVAGMSITKTIVLTVSDRSDSSLQARGIPNYLGAAAIAPDGLSAWVPSKQDNVMRGSLRDGLPLDFQSTVRAISSRIILGASLSEDADLRVDHDNSGVASAAVFDPTGTYLFVALQTSRQVALVDPAGGREIRKLVSGRAPQGLALSADGRRLFVDNFMDRTVGVIDLTGLLDGQAPRNLATIPTVASERLAPQVLTGKQFFYDALDPRLARDGYLSCASCHADGAADGRTWDLTHAGEGLRRTISLRGHAGRRLLHWSGNFDETQDFERQIRELAGGQGLMSDADYFFASRSEPMGTPKAGVSSDLDALSAYMASLNAFAPSPARSADGGLTPQAQSGKALFGASGCLGCHGGSDFGGTGDSLHDIGTIKPSSGNRLGGPLTGINTPTLRDAWSATTFLHDGSAGSVTAAIAAHASAASLTGDDLARLTAYVTQIGSEE